MNGQTVTGTLAGLPGRLQAAGTFLDGVPEGVVLGLSVLPYGVVGSGTVAAFFLGNIPGALSSSAEMRRADC